MTHTICCANLKMTFILWENEIDIFLSHFCSGNSRKKTLTIVYDMIGTNRKTQKRRKTLFCVFFDVNSDSQYRTAETNILWSKIFSAYPEEDCSAVSLRLLALMLYRMKAAASY